MKKVMVLIVCMSFGLVASIEESYKNFKSEVSKKHSVLYLNSEDLKRYVRELRNMEFTLMQTQGYVNSLTGYLIALYHQRDTLRFTSIPVLRSYLNKEMVELCMGEYNSFLEKNNMLEWFTSSFTCLHTGRERLLGKRSN